MNSRDETNTHTRNAAGQIPGCTVITNQKELEMNALTSPHVVRLLDRLFKQADASEPALAERRTRGIRDHRGARQADAVCRTPRL
jgi:hypothetical protein